MLPIICSPQCHTPKQKDRYEIRRDRVVRIQVPALVPNGNFKEAYHKQMPVKYTNARFAGSAPCPHLQVGDQALLIEGKITGDRRGLRYPSISGERIPSLNFLPPLLYIQVRSGRNDIPSRHITWVCYFYIAMGTSGVKQILSKPPKKNLLYNSGQ